MKDRVWEKKYLLPEFAVLFAAFIHHIWFMDKYVDRWLDGDLSAELVEGEILSKEWGIIAKDWMFSTELRVLNVPQVFSFFFHFTHDWHTVRILSAAVLVVILIFSVIILAKSMGIKHYPLLGLIFALPFSADYNNYVIYGLYYIPHIATVFLTAALVMQILNSDSKKKRAVLLIFAIVLSVLAVALLVTLLLLHRRTKALQRETSRLQEAKRQDVERIANVETCLSVLRHDITPFISYLQNDSLPEELKREVTSQLIRTFENIKSWTNLSIPSGLQFNPSRVPLQEVFDTVGTTTGNFKGLEIVYHPTEMAVVGDRQLIEIMLRNLVNNAIQHTERGRIDISARESEDSRFVEVCVRDTGSGMDEETIENLFRADKKIKPSSEHGYGTGFGLILCRYIIKKHDDNTLRGCRIWAEARA